MAHPLSATQTRRFVLATAGVDPERDVSSAVTRSQGVPDWEAAIAVAHVEGALPHFADLARGDGFPGMPKPVRAQLETLDRLHALRSGVLEARARTLAEGFDRAGVPLLFLKGAALATTVYPRFSDRPMGDLDVLVPRDRSKDAVAVARATGWMESARAPEHSFFEGHQHLRPMSDGSALGIGLDLHLHILPSHAPFRLTPDDLWGSAVPASEVAGGASVSAPAGGGNPLPGDVPALELLLLHVCLHFAWSHAFAVGAWKAFRDVHWLVRHPALDVNRFVDIARDARALGTVRWTLRLARTVGGVDAARTVEEHLPGDGEGWRTRVLARHLTALASASVPEGLPVWLRHRLWEWALSPDAEGHGGVRPWDRDEDFERAALPGTGDAHALVEHVPSSAVARVGVAARYLRSILRA